MRQMHSLASGVFTTLTSSSNGLDFVEKGQKYDIIVDGTAAFRSAILPLSFESIMVPSDNFARNFRSDD